MGNCNNIETTSKPTLKSFFQFDSNATKSTLNFSLWVFFNCRVIKNIFDQLDICLFLIKDAKVFLCFSVTYLCFIARWNYHLFKRKFPANIKQVKQNILKILRTSSSLELKLIGSSSKVCRLIKLIAHKYLELMYVQIIWSCLWLKNIWVKKMHYCICNWICCYVLARFVVKNSSGLTMPLWSWNKMPSFIVWCSCANTSTFMSNNPIRRSLWGIW